MLKNFAGWLYERVHKHKRPGYNYIKFCGRLYLVHNKRDGSKVDHGLVCANLVTTEFCEDMVDELITETSTWGDYRWHQSGIDTTPAAIGDSNATFNTTGCPAPVSGTQVENTSVIYESVATVPYTGTLAITEHGVGNNSTWGSATLMDRHDFTAVNVVNGDSIQFTYDLTCTAGG